MKIKSKYDTQGRRTQQPRPIDEVSQTLKDAKQNGESFLQIHIRSNHLMAVKQAAKENDAMLLLLPVDPGSDLDQVVGISRELSSRKTDGNLMVMAVIMCDSEVESRAVELLIRNMWPDMPHYDVEAELGKRAS